MAKRMATRVATKAGATLAKETGATKAQAKAVAPMADRTTGLAADQVAAMATKVKAGDKVGNKAEAVIKAVVVTAAAVKAAASVDTKVVAGMAAAGNADTKAKVDNKVVTKAGAAVTKVAVKADIRAANNAVAISKIGLSKADINRVGIDKAADMVADDQTPEAGTKIETKDIKAVAAATAAIGAMTEEMIGEMSVTNACAIQSQISSRKITSCFWSTSRQASRRAKANPPRLLIWSKISPVLASA